MALTPSCILDPPTTLATTREDNTTEGEDLVTYPAHPLSPLSPAESLENFPPTTPTEEPHSAGLPTIRGRLLEYREHTYPSPPTATSDPKHHIPLPSPLTSMANPASSLPDLHPTTPLEDYRHYFEAAPTIRGRLSEYRYPSPPSTASDPKHPVPLPFSTNTTVTSTTTNTATNIYDTPYDIPHDFLPSASSAKLLDSSVMAQRGRTRHSIWDDRDLFSERWPLGLQSIPEEGLSYHHSDGERSWRAEVLPPAQPPLSPTSPLLELRGVMPSIKPRQGSFNSSLSPLLPEWEPNAMGAFPSTSKGALSDASRPPPPSSNSAADSLSSPLLRPSLPLLEIPDHLTFRSYAPSPTSPLWLADELESFHGLPSPPGSDDTPDASSGCEAEHGSDPYMVSPPSSGPPDTPSPLLPLLQLDDGWDLDCDRSQKEDTIPPIPGLFEYPASPSASTRLLEPDSQVEEMPTFESTVDQGEELTDCSTDPLPWKSLEVEEGRGVSWSGNQERSGLEDQEMFDPELLRSPSVRFRECVQLPDDDDFDPHPAESLLRTPSPSRSPNPATSPSRHKPDSLLLRPLAAPRQGGDPDLLFPDASPISQPRPIDLDSDFDLNALDPDTMKRLPPQEVEEVQMLAALQAKASECERVAKDLEVRVAESLALDKEDEIVEDVCSGRKGEEKGEEDEGGATLAKAAAEARALAKREREKAKEAGALVRLKLMEIEEVIRMDEGERRSALFGDDRLQIGYTSPSGSSSPDYPGRLPPSSPTSSPADLPLPPPSTHRKHPRLAGVAQLVAKMFLNRPDSGSRRTHTILSSSYSIPSLSPSLGDVPSTSSPNSGSTVQPPSSPSSFHISSNPLLHSTAFSPTSPSSNSALSSAPRPKVSPYKYKHLWMKGVVAAGLHPQQYAIGGTLGATRQQPFAPYQRRYKFLRSSPLAKYSVVASEDDDPGDRTEHASAREKESQRGSDGDVGALWDDLEDDLDGGFEALRNPIMWDDI